MCDRPEINFDYEALERHIENTEGWRLGFNEDGKLTAIRTLTDD